MDKKKALPYLILFTVCLLITCVLLNIWKADLNVPFYYLTSATRFQYLNFDVNLYLAICKNLSQHGWIGLFPRLGTPGILAMQYYPFSYFQQNVFFCIKLLTNLGLSWGESVNIFYILTFPVISISAFYLFKNNGISNLIAGCMAILFAFMPYHIHTGQMHLALASYWNVPLCLTVCFWIVTGKFIKGFNVGKIPEIDIKRIIIAVIFALLISTSDVYYVAYSIFMYFVAGLIGFSNNDKSKRIWPVIFAASMALLTFLLVIIFISPIWFYQLKHGFVKITFERDWRHTEIWGLKIVQLFIPIRKHFLFNRIAEQYGPFPYTHVNESVALGMIGCLGFLSLIYKLLTGNSKNPSEDKLALLSKFNIAAVLFATVAGFATVFAFYVCPDIRSNYRMGIYIALFSIFAVGLFLENVKDKPFWQKRQRLFCILLILLTTLGVLDQTGRLIRPQYNFINKTYYAQDKYFLSVEKALPQDAKVFQLPYATFPEGGSIHNINMYEQFEPFLHTNHIKWSYGAIKGTVNAKWQERIASSSPEIMLKELRKSGFSAVLIDTYGYSGKSTLNVLKAYFKANGIGSELISNDGRYITFLIGNKS